MREGEEDARKARSTAPAPRQTRQVSPVVVAECCAGTWNAKRHKEKGSSQPLARWSQGGLLGVGTQPSLEEQVKRQPEKGKKANSFKKYCRARTLARVESERDKVSAFSCLSFWTRGQQTSSRKRQRINILGFVVHTLPVTSTRRCHCSVEAATDNMGMKGTDRCAGLPQHFSAEGVNSTYHDDHFAICANIEALCCTPETNIAHQLYLS